MGVLKQALFVHGIKIFKLKINKKLIMFLNQKCKKNQKHALFKISQFSFSYNGNRPKERQHPTNVCDAMFCKYLQHCI
jgi:hypothetical protein